MTVANLSTAAGGIFGTHVTWVDIGESSQYSVCLLQRQSTANLLEHAIQQALKTTASFGWNKAVKDIGDGNVSFLYLLLYTN